MVRIPASERTRERLKALEESLESEVTDALGREHYARGAAPGAGYRNGTRRGRFLDQEIFGLSEGLETAATRSKRIMYASVGVAVLLWVGTLVLTGGVSPS